MCALFNTLHSQVYLGAGAGKGPSRERFFVYALVGSGVWCEHYKVLDQALGADSFSGMFPGYLFQALRFVLDPPPTF